MNIQARKLELIEEFLKISDVSLIEKLEIFFKSEKKEHPKSEPKPMSINDLHEIIDQALLDKKAGRTISQTVLKKKIKSWK